MKICVAVSKNITSAVFFTANAFSPYADACATFEFPPPLFGSSII